MISDFIIRIRLRALKLASVMTVGPWSQLFVLLYLLIPSHVAIAPHRWFLSEKADLPGTLPQVLPWNEILHHLRNPGTIRLPCKCQWFPMVSFVVRNGLHPSRVAMFVKAGCHFFSLDLTRTRTRHSPGCPRRGTLRREQRPPASGRSS